MGVMAKPFCERPIITGPIIVGAVARNDLSISLIKIPGDTNLKFLIDI